MSNSGATNESSLLLTLAEISDLVSHSHDPSETLVNIVRLIQGRFHTDVCSVYLLEAERGELVLGATVGLKAASVGRVRMHLDEGLTGLVAEKMAPVTVADAFQHPRFKYFPEAGEDPYHSFLGVPLVEGSALQGVLVVQTLEPRTFSPNEVRMLVAVAAQLAPLVGGAHWLERMVATAHQSPEVAPDALPVAPGCSLAGRSLSPGVGRGRAYLMNGFDEWRKASSASSSGPDAEKLRLARALEAARDEISRLSQRISELVGEDHGAILQAQLMIMQDRTIEQDLTNCLDAGATAEGALLLTLDKYVAVFQKMSSPFFQERLFDVKDVFRRVLWHLRPPPVSRDAAGGRLVLVAREASVMDLFSVDLDNLAALVVEQGGAQSHAAILARSLGVPMVGQVPDLLGRVRSGHEVLVDGQAGLVYLDPSPDLLLVPDGSTSSPACPRLGPEAADSGLPRVEVNINLLGEVTRAVEQQAGGVGLYRSEFLLLARRTLPTEEEQVGIYRKLLTRMRGQPVTIRTFDLRPDKLGHCSYLTALFGHPHHWRQGLAAPAFQTTFKSQVRAVLRAATEGPTRILVPLITRTEQLEFVQDTLAQARVELSREGLEFSRDVALGIMIELPAAAAMVDVWAGHVDFVALGTNDLTASALGIDRDDAAGAGPDDLLHPGLLRLIHDVVDAVHQANRRVTVCGEMAADPDGILTLAAFQVDSISVPVHQLATTRRVLARHAAPALSALADPLLRCRSAHQARQLLRPLAGSL